MNILKVISLLFLISMLMNCKDDGRGEKASDLSNSLIPVSEVTASSTDFKNSSPWFMVDGSGMKETSGEWHHDQMDDSSMWISKKEVSGKIYIQYDLGKVYSLEKMEFWNYSGIGEQGGDLSFLGLKNVGIHYSLGGQEWIEQKGNEYPYQIKKTDKSEKNSPTSITFNGIHTRYVLITFDARPGIGNWGGIPGNEKQFGLAEVRFYRGDGFIAESAPEWDQLFVQSNGWTGADGIFTIPLSGNDEYIGGVEEKTLFLFSDTHLGAVDPVTRLRSNAHMINNSMAILENEIPEKNKIRFLWGPEGNYELDAVFSPLAKESFFAGKSPAKIANGSGLSFDKNGNPLHTNGNADTMWLSGTKHEGDVELILDFGNMQILDKMEIFNYNEYQSYKKDLNLFGLKNIRIFYSDNGDKWKEFKGEGYPYQLAAADGSDNIRSTNLNDGKNSPVLFNGLKTRFIKIQAHAENGDGNWVESTEGENRFGLSEILIFDNKGKMLFFNPTANSVDRTLSTAGRSAVYWLQDGFVYKDKLYLFPILVQNKPAQAGGFNFGVTDVNLIEIPLENGSPQWDLAEYSLTPLYKQVGLYGEEYIFGCGNLINTGGNGSDNPDGYIYIYGYNSFSSARSLVVARTRPDDISSFNNWEFLGEDGWINEIKDLKPIADSVSPELSVTAMGNDFVESPFLLTYMKDTMSGKISLAFADNPSGPFENVTDVYHAPESLTDKDIFSYNAKAHPHLSDEGELLISYNVNSFNMRSFDEADIYRPRFIRLKKMTQ